LELVDQPAEYSLPPYLLRDVRDGSVSETLRAWGLEVAGSVRTAPISRARGDNQAQLAAAPVGSSRAGADNRARSADDSLGVSAMRWSTATVPEQEMLAKPPENVGYARLTCGQPSSRPPFAQLNPKREDLANRSVTCMNVLPEGSRAPVPTVGAAAVGS
jgi:hypothetical protein